METLLDDLYYHGPRVFTRDRLREETNLFRQRTALFYTPTENLPRPLLGEGKLDVVVPIAFPTLFDLQENMAYRVPRLWVDLLQRATGKLRWKPMIPAKVTLIRYDSTYYSGINVLGEKALLDALKCCTTGRRDGRVLHYFGAILDDDDENLRELHIKQELVDDPAQAYSRIVVEPTDPLDCGVMTISLPTVKADLPQVGLP